ncbi:MULTISPECIES: carboxylate/amino acid/amine transporter [unclassified Arsenophonus]|uniref:carboxylate/amino acid/amine transporter n=1 Tax=unclassified Arsenophonus TaxID=2627083 RepID=UPI002864989C|nr:carboxylate/amino acid/amine transporter [Arsenophonus sp.]MDR5610394.1 carboxylate/amino acid/amine transporter [Arsenophonus sp.]MDR5614196.1 carboxylate/amino acid/amine transporter [Arsenophonus sp.]
MGLLVITTLLWAASFSLIGEYLAGQVDSWFAVLVRVALATMVFLPFLRWRGLSLKIILLYILVGAFQLGIMYLFVFQAYNYLSVVEFLLFTVLTPLYITLFYDLLERQHLRWGYLLSAMLAVIGAAIIRYDHLSGSFWLGLLYVQLANISFTIGQVGYKRMMEIYPIPQRQAFSWFYIGACTIALFGWMIFGDVSKLPTTKIQWGVLIWLGVGASGIGYSMWNYGATQVDAGTLAIMNNMLVPAGLLVNFVVWQQHPDWLSFILGSSLLLLSLWVHRHWLYRSTLSKID